MLSASSASIPANSNGAVTQEIRVVNSLHGEKNIMLKLKIGYTTGGVAVSCYFGISYDKIRNSIFVLFVLNI